MSELFQESFDQFCIPYMATEWFLSWDVDTTLSFESVIIGNHQSPLVDRDYCIGFTVEDQYSERDKSILPIDRSCQIVFSSGSTFLNSLYVDIANYLESSKLQSLSVPTCVLHTCLIRLSNSPFDNQHLILLVINTVNP